MGTLLVNLGFNNVVVANKIVAVVSANAAPIKRLKEAARRTDRLIDATNGRRTRTVVITDSNHIILSSSQPETITERLRGKN